MSRVSLCEARTLEGPSGRSQDMTFGTKRFLGCLVTPDYTKRREERGRPRVESRLVCRVRLIVPTSSRTVGEGRGRVE